MIRYDEVDSLPFVVSTRGWKTKDGPSTFLGCLSEVLTIFSRSPFSSKVYKTFYLFFSSSIDAKRLIGRRFDDGVVQSDMKHWPFNVINDNTRPKVQVDYKGETKSFYPEEISSMVLTKMKEIAEAYLGKVSDHSAVEWLYWNPLWLDVLRYDEVDSLPFVVSTRGWKTKDGPSTFLGCLSDMHYAVV